MTLKKPLHSIFVILLLTACTSTPKYYDKIEQSSDVNIPQGEVNIGLYVTEPSTPNTVRTVFDLDGEGQAELIKKLSGSNSQIMTALATPIRSSTSTPSIDNRRTTFRRTLIFTVSADGIAPADRLEEVHIQSTLDNDQWEIDSWSNYEHRTRNITLARIQNTTENQLSGEAGEGFPLTNILGLNGSATQTTQVNQDLISEVITYSPRPNDREISLSLKSIAPQVNIAGTYAITINISPKREEIKSVPVFRFNTTSGSESVRRNILEFVKNADQSIILNTIMPFRLRHVKNNENTIAEGDDTIVYYDTIDDFIENKSNTGPSNMSYPKANSKVLIDKVQIQQDINLARVLNSSQANPSVRLVKLYDPTRHTSKQNAQCIASQDIENLRSFLNWVNEKPSERIAFEKDNKLIYSIVDEHGNNISLGPNEKLITSLSKINYSSKDEAFKVPKACTNLN